MSDKSILLLVPILWGAAAPDLPPQAVVDAALAVAPALRRPSVDGIINDEAWRDAVPTTGIKTLRPSHGLQPSLDTEVRVAADRERMYVAPWSLDSDASRFAKIESGINARALDFAKLGRLFLQRDRWGQEQVVSPDWVAAATR